MQQTLVCLALGLLVGTAQAQPEGASGSAFFDAAYSRAYEDTMVIRMSKGIDRYFDRFTGQVAAQRSQYWNRDLSSPDAYRQSIRENRERFREITGVVDERTPVQEERFGRGENSALVAETDRYTVHQMRWAVLEGVWGEGLLLTPRGETQARVVALPDAGQTPEQITGLAPGVAPSSQFARRLAESGIEVFVPALINRQSTYSGSEGVASWQPWRGGAVLPELMTNQPHREWIYRQAYVMGRHLIGMEVQMVLAGMDRFEEQGAAPMGVVGYGEGGLLALYAAAMDERIDAALVSGYFGSREELWQEPVYRNVWGLLKRFGDAEIASMVMPRALIVEHSEGPEVDGPPPAQGEERAAATPGTLTTPSREAVEQEVERLRGFFTEQAAVQPDVQLVVGDGLQGTTPLGSEEALRVFIRKLGESGLAESGSVPTDRREGFSSSQRQKRMVRQLTDYFYKMALLSDMDRYQFIRGDRSSPQAWQASMQEERTHLREEIIGKVPQELLPPNPQRRTVLDEEHWTGEEVVLDVWPDVFAWGLLAVPKGLAEGEKRPVVVVQHGIGGTPTTPIRVDSYNNILPRLVERGFIVFAPHNPYQFNVRRAMPVKASVFSVIIPQHRQIVRWLKTLEHVDADRIGFYGKSWGGRTALRVPPFVEDYNPVVSSAYFSQWPRKVLTPHFRTSYMYTGSIGVYEFNLGNTFGHAEMAGLIAPRAFMVESGYEDGVSPPEWVGYDFTKVKRMYQMLGIGDRAIFGAHTGGHEVHAGTTFPFLHKHLNWPIPPTK